MERLERIQVWRKVGGADIDKEAELSNTYDMPAQASPEKVEAHPTKKAVINKVASAVTQKSEPDPLFEAFMGSKDKEEVTAVSGTQPSALPQMGALRPHVDVTSHEPPTVIQEKKAQHYALPLIEMYPLDSYVQVKTAARYFHDNFKFMEPSVRHEYCQNLVKRASALDVVTDTLIEKYGSAGYAAQTEFDTCFNARRVAYKDETVLGLLDKLAAQRGAVEPDVFAESLEQLDKVACVQHLYGGDVPDAYYTTFGKNAAALKEETAPDESVVIGNEYITRRRLAEFLQNNAASVAIRFGGEVGKELAKSPNDVFDSLPRDQKLILMRMANNDDSPVQQGVPTA